MQKKQAAPFEGRGHQALFHAWWLCLKVINTMQENRSSLEIGAVGLARSRFEIEKSEPHPEGRGLMHYSTHGGCV